MSEEIIVLTRTTLSEYPNVINDGTGTDLRGRKSLYVVMTKRKTSSPGQRLNKTNSTQSVQLLRQMTHYLRLYLHRIPGSFPAFFRPISIPNFGP